LVNETRPQIFIETMMEKQETQQANRMIELEAMPKFDMAMKRVYACF
jgi:hypothetical protein